MMYYSTAVYACCVLFVKYRQRQLEDDKEEISLRNDYNSNLNISCLMTYPEQDVVLWYSGIINN